MSQRGTEFIESWVEENFRAKQAGTEFDRRPGEWAEQCVAAAEKAGISRREIEEDFGDLQEFMRLAIVDASDQKAFLGEADGFRPELGDSSDGTDAD